MKILNRISTILLLLILVLLPKQAGGAVDKSEFSGFEKHFSCTTSLQPSRLYDPVIARFFSPDPYVQLPENTQNYNRYSYCLNNPLIYTDPTGEFWHIVIGAAVGGLINLGIKAYQGKINSFGDSLMAFGIGAAAGAIGAATGGAAFAAAGGAAGAAGGAVGTAFSSPVLSMGNTAYFGDPMMTGKQYLLGIAGGALLGGTVNGITALANGRSFMTGNLPSNSLSTTPTPSIQTPQQKGQEGVNRAIEDIKSQGGEILSKEVTLDVNGVRVRVDVAADFNGEIHLIEVKNGPFSSFTPNQEIAYPQMQLTDGVKVPVIPRGANALPLTQPQYGWQIGQPTTQYRLIIIRYK